MNNLDLYDNIIILLYFAAAIGIGLFNSHKKDKSINDYFLGGKTYSWITIGIIIFATNISSEHIIGLAGAGASKGLAVIQFEWLAIIVILFLGWFIAPIFLKNKILTVPQYFGQRYDSRTRTYLASISIFIYLITKIGVTLLICNYLLNSYLGLNIIETSLIIVLMTGVYTVIGGMSSVVNTQIFQGAILLLGAFLLTYFGLEAVGGIDGLFHRLPDGYFSIFKSVEDPDLPWTGILVGAPILAIWYWCADQYIVQRILCAKGIKEIKKGTVLTAVLKSFPILLLVVPGLIAVALNSGINGNEAFGYLLSANILPFGIKGVVLSGFFAALMSSLSASFHSSATLFALDIYKPRHKNVSDHKIILIGRLAATALVIIALSIVPLLRMVDSDIYLFLQSMQAFISPPIAAVFLISIFWKKATAKAAFYSLILCGSLGLMLIILSLIEVNNETLNYLKEINALHMAAILFWITVILNMAFSFVEIKILQKGNQELANHKVLN